MEIGTRVKQSRFVTDKKRDYWNQQGREPAKSNAKCWLDEALAERGTVMAILNPGLAISWDNGSVSTCLTYMVTEVNEGEK